MRSRLLDVALIAGLVVVAGGIMWTLFNLGSGTAPPPNTPTASPTATPASPNSATITPVAPGATAPTTSGGVGPAAGADPLASAAGAATPTDPTPAAGSATASGSLSGTPDRVVPPGTLVLDRVGFSFVTGGAGACGMVLEAWRHVAVSRDLLATYGCGAEVTVTLDDPAGGRSEVVGVIGDTMNPSFALTVNVYVAEDEDAFAYGLTTGTFAPR